MNIMIKINTNYYFTQKAKIGVPAEAIAYVIAIDVVLDIFIAVINSFEDVVSSIIVSHMAGILDIDTYNRLK